MLVNTTVPVTTGDPVLDTKVKPEPPSLLNYTQRQRHQEHSDCVCGAACEWQHLPPSKLQQTLQTPLCNPVGMTKAPRQRHQVKHKNHLRGWECLCGAALPVGSVSSWQLHSLQHSGHCICPAWGGFSLQLGTLKHLPSVPHLKCDQPMPIRSNWNNYEK